MEYLINKFLPYEYKKIAVESMALRIQKNIDHRLASFNIEYSSDITACETRTLPFFDVEPGILVIGKDIKRYKNKNKKGDWVMCDAYPQDLEQNIYKALCKQRHKNWHITIVYTTYPFRVPQGPVRNLEGFGALCIKLL